MRISPRLAILSLFLLSAPLIAQSVVDASGQGLGAPSQAKQGDPYRQLIEDRLQFVREMYQLSEPQIAKLRKELESLVSDHATYMSVNEQTLRRHTKAICLVLPQQTNITAGTKKKIEERIQGQIYEIQAKAPLSLANVVEKVERGLSKDAIQRGRKRITLKYAFELKKKPLEIKSIDRLILKPVQRMPVGEPSATMVAQKEDRPNPPLSNKAAPKPRDVPPPKPSFQAVASSELERIHPAPPVEKWSDTIRTLTARYGFSNAQKKVAERILKRYIKQAETKQTSTAQPPLREKLYEELRQRIDSVASIEQLRKAGVPKSKNPPIATTPKPPPPAAPSPRAARPPKTPPVKPPARPNTRRSGVIVPPKPPITLDPAPAIGEWPEKLEKASSLYGFSAAQKKLAQRVLKSCQSRAEKYREQNKAAYQKLDQLSDPQEKAKQLKKVNLKVDKLYNELNERIKSIASLEQQKNAEKKQKKTPSKK